MVKDLCAVRPVRVPCSQPPLRDMPVRQAKYVPKHRSAPPEPALVGSLRRSVRYSGVAVAATGIAVTGGIAVNDQAPGDSASATIAAAQAEREAATVSTPRGSLDPRGAGVSRSDRRTPVQEGSRAEGGSRRARAAEDLADLDPREVALRLMPEYGLSAAEFECLDALWVSESDWDPTADNPTSSAYGIPQALTAGTHDNLPADYMTNPVSQIRWGLWYIHDSYGTACSAWEFKQANDWY